MQFTTNRLQELRLKKAEIKFSKKTFPQHFPIISNALKGSQEPTVRTTAAFLAESRSRSCAKTAPTFRKDVRRMVQDNPAHSVFQKKTTAAFALV